MKNNLCRSLLLACIPFVSACSNLGQATYTLEYVEGWVIDADTKQPIEGAVVIGHWVIGDRNHYGKTRSVVLQDSTTDKNGHYRLTGVGPFYFPERMRFTRAAPELFIFHGGYVHQRLVNQSDTVFDTGMPYYTIRSEWYGKNIEIKPFTGSLDDHINRVNLFSKEIEHFAIDNPELWCGWKRIPNTVRVLNKERARLLRRGADQNNISTIDKRLLIESEEFAKEARCGSPREFFKYLRE